MKRDFSCIIRILGIQDVLSGGAALLWYRAGQLPGRKPFGRLAPYGVSDPRTSLYNKGDYHMQPFELPVAYCALLNKLSR